MECDLLVHEFLLLVLLWLGIISYGVGSEVHRGNTERSRSQLRSPRRVPKRQSSLLG